MGNRETNMRKSCVVFTAVFHTILGIDFWDLDFRTLPNKVTKIGIPTCTVAYLEIRQGRTNLKRAPLFNPRALSNVEKL